MVDNVPLRVTIRMFRYNPHPFIVKDVEKQEYYRWMATLFPWNNNSGVRIQRLINKKEQHDN